MGLEQELKSETEKWLKKLEKETAGLKTDNKEVKDVLDNLFAYIKDAKYFMQQKDWIRAFEAVVYAWGILETLRHLGLV